MTEPSKLNLDEYFPFYVRSIANRLNMIDTRLYSKPLGIGLNEWVCLALLAREDNISATRICEVSGYDKAVISRSVRSLIDRGFVAARSVPEHNRRQLLKLTAAGRETYRTVEQLVLKRRDMLLQDISEDDRARLIMLLAKILETSDAMLRDGVENVFRAGNSP